jgi:hypothetical protein
LSHVTSGYIYFSPSRNLVRADEAYDGGLASSVFDYSNTTKDGLVLNTLTSYEVNGTKPTVWTGYVNSNYPLFTEDLLIRSGAVFGGLVKRDLLEKHVASVSFRPPLLIQSMLIHSSGISCTHPFRSLFLSTLAVFLLGTTIFRLTFAPES